MSVELLLVFLVTFLAFGPKKLPMLADHLAKLLRLLMHFKAQVLQFWESKFEEITLLENEKKAREADKIYQKEREEN